MCEKKGSLACHTICKKGLAHYIDVKCSNCDNSVNKFWTSEKTGTGKKQVSTINREIVFASLQSSMGAEHLNIDCMQHSTFHEHASNMYNLNPDLHKFVFKKAVSIVRAEHFKLKGDYQDDGSVLDIAVTFDGSWHTKGHDSNVGLGAIIDELTGLVIDLNVTSKFCQVCSNQEILKETDPDKYKTENKAHVDSGKCEINFTGTSGSMEVYNGRQLWNRSLQQHKLRYVTFIGDGDSKLYNQLSKDKPYGEDCPVVKEECINHVSKRLGTALRSISKRCSKSGTRLGGKQKGGMTQSVIKKLQKYYTRAIWNNSTVDEIKRAILATLYHGFSTDKKPQHSLCPTCKNSWCKFNSAAAYNRLPANHKDIVKLPLNEELLGPHILPIYERLTADDLLNRCLRKKTQNANESFHSVVWAKCPKSNHQSKSRIEHAALTAAIKI